MRTTNGDSALVASVENPIETGTCPKALKSCVARLDGSDINLVALTVFTKLERASISMVTKNLP